MSLWLAMALGCVIPYGEPVETAVTSPQATPVQFAGVEADLAALLRTSTDADQIARLEVAQALVRDIKSQDPEAQRVVFGYLLDVLASERRLSDPGVQAEIHLDTTIIETDEIAVEEEVLDGEEEAPRLAAVDTTAMRQRARSMLAMDDPAGAMAALSACQGEPCWPEVEELWSHAEDVFIRQQADAVMMRLREILDERDPVSRRNRLGGLRSEVEALLEAHAQARYAPELETLLERINAEITAADEE
ncbi:MAG: hypothetical protein AAFV53_01980 [Myxococcota bacterium]